jgi:hypothetical protein
MNKLEIHSPEPWEVVSHGYEGFQINTHSSEEIFARPAQMRYTNAERIVACVNACQGIPTGDLQQGRYRIIPSQER